MARFTELYTRLIASTATVEDSLQMHLRMANRVALILLSLSVPYLAMLATNYTPLRAALFVMVSTALAGSLWLHRTRGHRLGRVLLCCTPVVTVLVLGAFTSTESVRGTMLFATVTLPFLIFTREEARWRWSCVAFTVAGYVVNALALFSDSPILGSNGSLRQLPWLSSMATFAVLIGIARTLAAEEAQRRDVLVARSRELEALRARELEQSRALEHNNRKLIEAGGEMRRFAFTAAHDLRAPLRNLVHLVEFFVEDYGDALDDPDAHSYLKQMQTQSERMTELVDTLLRYAQAGNRPPPSLPVELDSMLEQVRNDLSADLRAAQGKLDWGALPAIRADAVTFRQLLQNLVSNAIKFRSPLRPPVIEVQCNTTELGWEVAVVDNGIGIPDKYVDTVFRPFERGETPGDTEGVGLGLATCERIAEQHGGRIWAESTEGEGTTIRVTIPREVARDLESERAA